MTDLDAAVAWYTETLDFRVMEVMANDEISFTFVAPPNDESLCLELVAGGDISAKPVADELAASLGSAGWHHVYWRVDSTDEAVTELKRRRVNILMEPTDIAPLKRRIAFFADPWGNVFELTQPLDERR